MLATILFQQLWDAIHERNPDGSRRYRYFVLEGSSRSSKTASIIQVLDLLAQSELHWRLCAYRNTKKDCKDTVFKDMERYFRIWPPIKRTLNKTESFFTYQSGSTLEIHGADNEVQTMGANKQVSFLNEPYKIAPAVFNQIDMRTSEIVILDWNPKEKHFIDDLKKDPRCKTIHSTFRINPFCPPEERHKILSYQPVKRCALVEGGLLTPREAFEYDLLANPFGFSRPHILELLRCRENEDKSTANDFFWSVYGLGIKAERPNRIFNWTEISDQQFAEIYGPELYAVDFGEVDPMAILHLKYYDGALYIKELYYGPENRLRERLNVTEKLQVSAVEEGLIVWLMNKLGMRRDIEMICDLARQDKIRALRAAGFNAFPCHKPPGSILDTISLLLNLRVYYTRSSINVANEQELYSWKEDRYGTVIEEPEDTNNHTTDAARYGAQRLRHLGIIKVV